MKIRDLTILVQWLQEADIEIFEIDEMGVSLRLVMQRPLQSKSIESKVLLPPTKLLGRGLHRVVANTDGLFLTSHPLSNAPLAAAGGLIAVGDVLGLMKVTDVTYRAVLSDQPGQLLRTLAPHGQPISQGTPLFELRIS